MDKTLITKSGSQALVCTSTPWIITRSIEGWAKVQISALDCLKSFNRSSTSIQWPHQYQQEAFAPSLYTFPWSSWKLVAARNELCSSIQSCQFCTARTTTNC